MVFVLDTNRVPLAPCHAAVARKLLRAGKAAVMRYSPFTIILARAVPATPLPDLRIKLDPGAKVTGIALVRDKTGQVLWAANLEHRGGIIRDRLQTRRERRRARRRRIRYRGPRFLNRGRRDGWLPPSLESRVANVLTWVDRLRRWSPVARLSLESVKFDTQQLQEPEIAGVEYQRGELFGYEVREYLLVKFRHTCVYCQGKSGADVLHVDHVIPASRGGTDRVSNLVIACQVCNQAKGKQTAAEFGHPQVQVRAAVPLRDAAAINATRAALRQRLIETGLHLEVGTGGRTKFNRARLGLPKDHWLDAACVGESTPERLFLGNIRPLLIRAMGHGMRQRCRTEKWGFPIRHAPRRKRFMGFATGDLVRAIIPSGKHAGVHVGRATIRFRPSFKIGERDAHPKNLRLLQRSDGYSYASGEATLACPVFNSIRQSVA